MAQHTSGRTVLLYPPDEHAVRVTTHRLLEDLGHDVALTTSVDQVVNLLRDHHADLLIVDESWRDISHAGERRLALISKIGDLPPDCRPKAVTIFADESDPDAPSQPTLGAPSAHIHLFVKPYHIHGLLAVLREMGKRDNAATRAPQATATH